MLDDSNTDNDGWQDVTDARETKAILGIKGVRASASALPKAPPTGGAPLPSAPVDLDAPATMPTGQAAQAAMTKVGASRAMLKQLNYVRGLYDKNMSAGGLAGLAEYNPFSKTNQQFDGAVAHIPLLARQAFRVAGSGADSDKELKLITDAMPDRWSTDTSNHERFTSLDRTLRGFITSYGGLAGYSPAQVKAMAASDVYSPPGSQAAPPRPNADALRRKYGLR